MISIRNLSKSFGKKQILSDINLEFERGKVYGIVGPNGAGKTTLFRCIAGLEVYNGDVDGEYQKIKNHLGYLPTNPVFMSKITGWEYLKLVSIARGQREDDFNEKNIFDLPLEEYAENYSTGMKKKLALLALLLQSNDIFIFDEPYNGVDIQSSMLITDVIKRLKSSGKTILIASHIFSTLKETCDVIHLIENGSIIMNASQEAFGKVEEKMKLLGNHQKLDNFNF